VSVAGRTFPIDIGRHHRARRYVLRVTPAGTLKLTVPRGASIAGGLEFTARQTGWIAREWARQQQRSEPWQTGTLLWWRGVRVALDVGPTHIACGGESIARPGTPHDVRAVVERHLRGVADRELPPRCLAFAATCGVSVSRVAVRNQRSRWGACSSRGVITLNWRLLQMPPCVSDYVIWHELMHRRQANHSRRFWREVESVCHGWRDAERWLRRHGREVL
jgi:predicted metal-dependent hydrolase